MTATESPSEGVRIAAFSVIALLLQGAPPGLDDDAAEAQPRYLQKEKPEYAGARAAYQLNELGAARKLVQALVSAVVLRPLVLNGMPFPGWTDFACALMGGNDCDKRQDLSDMLFAACVS